MGFPGREGLSRRVVWSELGNWGGGIRVKQGLNIFIGAETSTKLITVLPSIAPVCQWSHGERRPPGHRGVGDFPKKRLP